MKLSLSLLLCVLIHHGLSAPPIEVPHDDDDNSSLTLAPLRLADNQEQPAHQHSGPPRHLPTLPLLPGIHSSALIPSPNWPPQQHQILAGPPRPPQDPRGPFHSQNHPQQYQHRPGPERGPHRWNPYPGPEHRLAPPRMNPGSSHPQNHPQQQQHQQQTHMHSGPSQHQPVQLAGEANVLHNMGRYGCGHEDCKNDTNLRFDAKGYKIHLRRKHTISINHRQATCNINDCRTTIQKTYVTRHMKKHPYQICRVDHRPWEPPEL